MSFLRHAEIYPDALCLTGTGELPTTPQTHRNEFPVGYSLAGCSPAESASASPTALILQPFIPFVDTISANGHLSLISVSQLGGAVHSVPAFPRFPGKETSSAVRPTRKGASRS
jgi:hypothetical protein